MADVKMAEYLMADTYVNIAIVMASAGTLLQTYLLYNVLT